MLQKSSISSNNHNHNTMPRALKTAYKNPLLAPRKSSSSQQVSQPKSPSIKNRYNLRFYLPNKAQPNRISAYSKPQPNRTANHLPESLPQSPTNHPIQPLSTETPTTMDTPSKQPPKPSKTFEPTFTGFRGLTPEQEDEARVRAASTHWRAKVEDKKAQKSSAGAGR